MRFNSTQALLRNGRHSGLADQSQSSEGHEQGWVNTHTWQQISGTHGHGNVGYGVPLAHGSAQGSEALPGPGYGYGLAEAPSYV